MDEDACTEILSATKVGLGTHVYLLPAAKIFDMVKSCIQVSNCQRRLDALDSLLP
jgi:hypothetical protein